MGRWRKSVSVGRSHLLRLSQWVGHIIIIFIKCNILTIETILGAYMHLHTHAHMHTHKHTHTQACTHTHAHVHSD